MIEMISSLFEGILLAIPSSADKKINKNFKLLQKEVWYRKLLYRHGTLIQMNNSLRHFICQYDIKSILNDSEKLKIFQADFKKILVDENL
ncbi:hypothetical protein NDK25_11435 [Niallia taxi]|nr:hypothetical protein [Niallia taxi]MDE5052849.1 hypothetical protein [Niallia taxi]